MSPLRAVVPRGHIALHNTNSGAHLLLDRASHLRLSATTNANQRLQTRFAVFAITANPCRQLPSRV
jgi:hypothetical protein